MNRLSRLATRQLRAFNCAIFATLLLGWAFTGRAAALQHFNEAQSTNVSRDGISSIGYGGGYWDPDARLCLMRNRWNDPELGRFITRDPTGYVDGMSLYLYAKGNPLVNEGPPSTRERARRAHREVSE